MSLSYPNIDPVAISVGPLSIHWYGLMYLFGFLAAYLLGRHRAQKAWHPIHQTEVEDLIFYCAVGVILGGRLGYVFFYNFDKFLEDPVWLFRIWEGGMAFHGGLMGVMLAVALYAKKIGCRFFELLDFFAPLVPIGLGLGRIGNFIGGELWGRETDVAWGMIFPGAGDVPRHPSQLYQAFLEGILFFLILWLYSVKPRPSVAISGMFMIFYGLFRILVEFVREPDAHIGFIAWGWLTMGQLLSLPMIMIGVAFMVYGYRHFGEADIERRIKTFGERKRKIDKMRAKQGSKKRKSS